MERETKMRILEVSVQDGEFELMKKGLRLLGVRSSSEQKGRKSILVHAITALPTKPYMIPPYVTPPLVPLGTRSVGFVRRKGCCWERIPSSLDNVSAVTET